MGGRNQVKNKQKEFGKYEENRQKRQKRRKRDKRENKRKKYTWKRRAKKLRKLSGKVENERARERKPIDYGIKTE